MILNLMCENVGFVWNDIYHSLCLFLSPQSVNGLFCFSDMDFVLFCVLAGPVHYRKQQTTKIG